ncbi:hypothetical protein BCVP_CDS0157 [Bacillus phage BC-VP]|nr:hypothetical protein BCVP_CDS0157 [Bacillus phage BC-VP]
MVRWISCDPFKTLDTTDFTLITLGNNILINTGF